MNTTTNPNIANQKNIVNSAERKSFLESIRLTKHAGISQIQTITYAISLHAHRQAFLAGKRGKRDGQRAALFLEASSLRNAEARVLSFYVALARAGYRGSVVPEDVAAAQVAAATGGLCAPRTFRRALSGLCRRGWLSKSEMTTGTKVLTNGGKWVTRYVVKISIPFATSLLAANRSLSFPRPKLPQMSVSKGDPPPIKGGGSSLVAVNVDNNSTVPAADIVANEETQLVSAPPAPITAQTSPPLKQKKNKQSRYAGRAHGGAVPFARQARSKISKTWHNARMVLLHDLATAGASETTYRVASLQTDLLYPPLFPSAIDWERYILVWLELDWKKRRRTSVREILPALNAWCHGLIPPDPADLDPSAEPKKRAEAEEQLAQWRRCSQILKSLPHMLINDSTPPFVREKIHEVSWVLECTPMLLYQGKILLSDLAAADRQKLWELARLLNLSD